MHDISYMSHQNPVFTLHIFPSSEKWQHRASAFPILSTSLATAATISYTHCSPPYPNSTSSAQSITALSQLWLRILLYNFGCTITWNLSFVAWIVTKVEYIFSVQYDLYITTTNIFIKKKVLSLIHETFTSPSNESYTIYVKSWNNKQLHLTHCIFNPRNVNWQKKLQCKCVCNILS